MRRISTNMNNNDVQYRLRNHESKLNTVNNQLGSQRRIQQLRDDPIAAGHLVRYQSFKGRIDTFETNAQTVTEKLTVREGYMNDSLQIMQRVRELAVAGANGTFTKEDLVNMASEVDELLKQLIQNANAVDQDGNSLFAGTNTKSTAFDVELGNVAGSAVPLIETVTYNGNVDTNRIEIDENQYLNVDNSGNRTFWAEHQQLFTGRDASGWQADRDSVIAVDGHQIEIKRGDNVYSLISKINDSGAAVKASIDPVSNGLNLITTDPRQLWLEDISGTTFTDLGVISSPEQRPPYNLNNDAVVSGGSMFDSVIALRDAMLAGDHESIGGRVLGTIDQSVDNLVTRIAEAGSEHERATLNIARNSQTSLNVTQMISTEGDLDFTKAVTDMRMLDYVHQATLSVAGKLYSSSLLNYMR
ncbi:MAG: flagellar hook-associated protein 3 [Treponema sp.]|uniref:flagellar hook-associated protein 3 n=1 Tax=Treponema sp. TaxID=166 RepID=UPI001B69D0C8|nr:flagellar hook-associated protein 3 [Treponema sp.]MBP5402854.1 flagellar hook-associated protein 3 [Treponema sp.]MBR5933648.1 flagellar hook-associated protein 3 [Treponema sp.]